MKRLAAFLMFWSLPAAADVPRVVTDIAPVHSLVAMVMEGVGEPVLLLDGSSGPHGGALRPSQARALDGANIVIWMGAALTPWLAEGVERGEAETLALLDWSGTATLPLREEFGGHDHEEHDHGDEAVDPHAWLDPVNARLWLGEIAAMLGEADPRNAAEYGANAREGMAAIKVLTAEVGKVLAPVEDTPFAVEHDAFHYFEDRFGLSAVAAHSSGDGDRPGPQRMRALLARLGEGDIQCLFAEAGSSSRMLDRVPKSVQVVRLDPVGSGHEPGSRLYPALIRGMAADVAGCLSR